MTTEKGPRNYLELWYMVKNDVDGSIGRVDGFEPKATSDLAEGDICDSRYSVATTGWDYDPDGEIIVRREDWVVVDKHSVSGYSSQRSKTEEVFRGGFDEFKDSEWWSRFVKHMGYLHCDLSDFGNRYVENEPASIYVEDYIVPIKRSWTGRSIPAGMTEKVCFSCCGLSDYIEIRIGDYDLSGGYNDICDDLELLKKVKESGIGFDNDGNIVIKIAGGDEA